MAILKSAIIDKTVRDIVPTFIDEVSHKTWRKLPTSTINLLSNCILRYANSYGATYQISQTKELTIVSNKGQSYTLESYGKFLNLIIVDYQDPSEDKPMKIVKQSSYQIGDRAKIREDLEKHPNSASDMCKLAGTIVTITGTEGRGKNGYEFEGCSTYYWSAGMFEGLVIEDTQPTDIKVGTHWERLHYFNNHSPKGEIITVHEVGTEYDEISVWYSSLGEVSSRNTKDFLDNFKPRPDLDSSSVSSTKPIVKRNLAFYKESGEHWTESELDFVRAYCGDSASRAPMGPLTSKRKYAYYDENTNSSLKVYLWDNQTYPEKLEQVSYESIFGTSTKEQTKAVKSKPTKPKPVAQPEPNKPTKSENTFMSKIKASASATVDQNKQALVIASKMEAGRIINKQVLKQLTPHLPFFLQGYAKSPFAPFVAANLVAMVANHTGNSKLTKVSDLMLLGAADSGVAAFNLDKIVDDILSNIKLPAGILDDNDDN